MILKFVLSPEKFAGLAAFLASEGNTIEVLKQMHPDREITFVGGGGYYRFADILKSTPNQKGSYKGEVNVALTVAERYKTDMNFGAEEKLLPRQYLTCLLRAIELFPYKNTFARIQAFDSSAQPLAYRSTPGFAVIEHISLGEVVFEKRVDGKLYVNDVQVVRRPVPKELGSGDRNRMPFVADEDKSILLNACFYDAIVADPFLMPEGWTGDTYFRGTIFESHGGHKWIKGLSRHRDDKLYAPVGGIGHHNIARDASWEAILAK